ncbi:TniQ family protein [Streptomyces sp. NPDC058864]
MIIRDVLPRLPRRAALIAGESTASFLVRLAGQNGWSFGDLSRHIGGPRDVTEVDPRQADVWLGPVAKQRLAEVTGWPARRLEQALPSLSQSSISARARRQVQLREYPAGREPVRACDLCVAGRSDGVAVWRVDREAGLVCLRHQRWMGQAQGTVQLSVQSIPEVAGAHERRLRLERKTGAYGQALVADAVQVAVYWWQCRQMASKGVWRERERALGVTREDLWAVPMLVYPEAMTVAEAMTVRERQRAVGRSFADGPAGWTTGRWVRWVGQRLGMEQEMESGGDRALRAWLVKHRNTMPVVQRLVLPPRPSGYRSVPLRMLEPHREVAAGELEAVSCLPWRLGSPMTSASRW